MKGLLGGARGRERESNKSWILHGKQTSVVPENVGFIKLQCGRTLLWLNMLEKCSSSKKNPLLFHSVPKDLFSLKNKS